MQPQKQVLWRSVIHSTGSTLLWVLILLVLGGLYLSVSAKAASAGRKYLRLDSEVEAAKRRHSEVVALHAEVTSPQRMMELASSMGFRPATLQDVRFLNSLWSSHKTSFRAPVPRSMIDYGRTMVSPAFTETLMDALKRMLGVGGAE